MHQEHFYFVIWQERGKSVTESQEDKTTDFSCHLNSLEPGEKRWTFFTLQGLGHLDINNYTKQLNANNFLKLTRLIIKMLIIFENKLFHYKTFTSITFEKYLY